MKCKVHKYKKVRYGPEKKTIIWKCMNCSHHTQDAIIVGNPCICHACGNIFTMTNANRLRQTFPKCGCTSKKASSQIDKKLDESLDLDGILKRLAGD